MGDEGGTAIRSRVQNIVLERVRRNVSALIANLPPKNSRFRVVRGSRVFRGPFFQGAPYDEREQRGAPLVTFDGAKEAVNASVHFGWVLVLGSMICASRREISAPLNQVSFHGLAANQAWEGIQWDVESRVFALDR